MFTSFTTDNRLVVYDANTTTIANRTGGSSDQWGATVDINGDLFVAASVDNYVKIFERTGGAWNLHDEITSPASGENFGSSVAVGTDICAVGAPSRSSDSGAVYLYYWNGSSWVQTAQYGTSARGRGTDVAASGNTVIVGEPHWNGSANPHPFYTTGTNNGRALVFVNSGGTWSLEDELYPDQPGDDDDTGYSVAIDGDTAVVGAPNFTYYGSGTYNGRVYIYTRTGGVWSLQQTINGPGGSFFHNQNFGSSVSISGDTIAVADRTNSDTYIYTRSGSVWSLQQTISETGLCVSVDGDSLIIHTSTNDLKEYTRSGSTWTAGSTVAVGADGVNSCASDSGTWIACGDDGVTPGIVILSDPFQGTY